MTVRTHILRAVNRARLTRGFEPVPYAALRLRATPRRVFAEEGRDTA